MPMGVACKRETIMNDKQGMMRRKCSRARLAWGFILALSPGLVQPLQAGNYTWVNTAAGAYDWANGGNWTPTGYPQAAGDVANLTANIAGAQTITLNQSTTMGTLNIGDADASASFTIMTNGAGGSLVFDNGSSATTATITQVAGSMGDTLAAPLQLNCMLLVSNAAVNTLTLSGNISGSGSLTKNDAHTLLVTGNSSVSLPANGLKGGGTLILSGGLFTNLSLPFGSIGNTLVISNGAACYGLTGNYNNGNGGPNTLRITGTNSVLRQTAKIQLINAGDKLVITDGGTLTNNDQKIVLGSTANTVSGCVLEVSNGGRVVGGLHLGNGGSNCTGVISGANAGTGAQSLWIVTPSGVTIGYKGGDNNNTLTVGSGGIVTNNTITIGNDTASANSLIITNGGRVFSSGNAAIGKQGTNNAVWIGGVDPVTGEPSSWSLGSSSLTIGTLASALSNVVTVTRGGVLECNTLSANIGVGNAIIDNGGILQFTTATPAMTVGVVVTNGTVSFKNVTLVNLTNNWGGTQLATNLAWQGNNTLRLNGTAASNTLANGYTLGTQNGPTNYARLELINGSTIVKGNKPLTVDSTGSMLVSNTTATIVGALTNCGTLTLANSSLTVSNGLVIAGGTLSGSGIVSGVVTVASGTLSPGGGASNALGTLTFSSNLTFSGAATVAWGYNAQACDLIQLLGTNSLPASLTINIVGSGPLPANPAIFSFPSSASAPSVKGWTINPPGAYVVSSSSTNISVRLSSMCTIILLK